MVREYELMYIVRPEMDDEAVSAAVDAVNSLVATHGGEVYKTTMWGKRRLAYEVKHLRDGHYVIAKLRLDGAKVAAFERALGMQEAVFRHLMVVDEIGVTESGEGEEGVDGDTTTTATAEGEEPAAPATVATAADDAEEYDDEPVAVGAGLDEEE